MARRVVQAPAPAPTVAAAGKRKPKITQLGPNGSAPAAVPALDVAAIRARAGLGGGNTLLGTTLGR